MGVVGWARPRWASRGRFQASEPAGLLRQVPPALHHRHAQPRGLQEHSRGAERPGSVQPGVDERTAAASSSTGRYERPATVRWA